jgi:hypothetical protein
VTSHGDVPCQCGQAARERGATARDAHVDEELKTLSADAHVDEELKTLSTCLSKILIFLLDWT